MEAKVWRTGGYEKSMKNRGEFEEQRRHESAARTMKMGLSASAKVSFFTIHTVGFGYSWRISELRMT